MPVPPPLPPDRPDLAERYGGGSPRWPQRLPLVVVAIVLVTLLVLGGWGLAQRSTGVRAGVLGYGDITPTSITITLEVVRNPEVTVVCDVAAVGENQVDVGAERIDVPEGGGERAVVRAVIATASAPKAARLLSCQPLEPSARGLPEG